MFFFFCYITKQEFQHRRSRSEDAIAIAINFLLLLLSIRFSILLQGIVHAAVYMKSKLIGEEILQKAFARAAEHYREHQHPSTSSETGTTTTFTVTTEFRLVLVGHSLGAGTAAILAVLLREEYPNLHCYSFSPPGGLLR